MQNWLILIYPNHTVWQGERSGWHNFSPFTYFYHNLGQSHLLFCTWQVPDNYYELGWWEELVLTQSLAIGDSMNWLNTHDTISQITGMQINASGMET